MDALLVKENATHSSMFSIKGQGEASRVPWTTTIHLAYRFAYFRYTCPYCQRALSSQFAFFLFSQAYRTLGEKHHASENRDRWREISGRFEVKTRRAADFNRDSRWSQLRKKRLSSKTLRDLFLLLMPIYLLPIA